MRTLQTLILVTAVALAAAPALAHDTSKQNMNMSGMNMSGMDMKNMMGMHDMSATVSAIDLKTGLVDLDAGGMKLKVHFPPASLTNIKPGDGITIHLGFTKP